MGRVTSNIGLITGVPITQTVDQLIALQARPRDLIVARNQKLSKQQVAATELTALLLAFEFTTNNLGKPSVFDARSIASSAPTLLAATSSGQPPLGSFQFTPLQTVQSQQWLSSGVANSTAAVGPGSLSLRFGGFIDEDTNLDLTSGGSGFTRGKIRITDRSGASAEIDLRFARTADDVLRAISDNQTINVRAEAHGDSFRLVDETGQTTSNLKVQEVGGGTTAVSLGLAGINVAAPQADGQDIVRLFTQLDLNKLNDGGGVRFNTALPDLQVSFRDGSSPLSIDFRKLAVAGTKAAATSPGTQGTNARVQFTAVTGGAAYDGVTISFVDNAAITAGSETVAYDESNPADKKLIFQIDAGNTTANQIIAALNNHAVASQKFTAAAASGSNGTGLIDAADTVVTSGGAAVEPQPAGTETTLGHVLTTLNAADPLRLKAELSVDGDRIVLTDLTAGAGAYAVTALNGSKAAADLGLTTAAAGGTITSRRLFSGLKTSLLFSLKGGAGFGTLGSLSLTDRSGATANVNLAGIETVQGAIDAINGAGLGIAARVNDARNGLLLADTTGATASNLIVANGDATNSADKLQIAVNAAATSKNSGSLQRRVVSENTLLASLNGGAGVAKGTFTLQDTDGHTSVVNLGIAGIETVGDVIAEINRHDLGIEARVNDAGDGILLVDTLGGSNTLQVREGSSTAAADLHLLTAATTINVGGTPTKVIDGSTTLTISLTAQDTLDTLVTKINALNFGVTAGVFNDGSSVNPLRLSLLSQRAGTAGQISIDASQSVFTFQETARAQDALLLFGSSEGSGTGVLAASSSNTFTNILPGVTLNVLGTSATAISVTVSNTDTSLLAGVKAAIDSFNRLRNKLNQHTAYDAELNIAGDLVGDATALQIDVELGRLFSSQFAGAGSIRSLETLGISLNDDGTIDYDAEQLKSKFASDPAAVKEFFTKENVGFSAKFKKSLESLANEENSLLAGRLETLANRVDSNNEKISFLNARLEKSRERLLAQYVRMEIAIAQLQANQAALGSLAQLASTSAFVQQ